MTGAAHTQAAPGSADSKEALLHAAQAAVEGARRKAGEGRGSGRHSFRVILLVSSVGLFALAVYLLAARPAWFFTPAAPLENAQIQEASTRLILVRESELVRAYLAANGRLPRSLAEAGSAVQGVAYSWSEDGSFTLKATAGDRVVEFQSTDSVAAFLGNSMETIQQRVGR